MEDPAAGNRPDRQGRVTVANGQVAGQFMNKCRRRTQMKVLIVGSGGREHAIAWKVAQSQKVDKIYCAPGNAGIAEVAECVPIGAMEFDKLVAFAKEKEIDLTDRRYG